MSAAKSIQATVIDAVNRRYRTALHKLSDLITDVEIDRMAVAGCGLDDVYKALTEEWHELSEHECTLRTSLALTYSSGYRVREGDEEAMRAADRKRRPLRIKLRDTATVTPAPPVPPQLTGRRARPRSNETVEAIPVILLDGFTGGYLLTRVRVAAPAGGAR